VEAVGKPVTVRQAILPSMSQDNIELARHVVDAIRRGNLSRLIELTDPEVEWYSLFAELGEQGRYPGHPGIRRYMNDLSEAWEMTRAEIDGAVAVGAVVLLIGQLHYRGKGSGVESKSPMGWMFKFRDRKVLCFRTFREPEQILQTLLLPSGNEAA
jgi:ketosteroid isomerase-like protein